MNFSKKRPDPELLDGFEDALYEFEGKWPDYVDSVSPEQAILCWKIVEYFRKDK